ncbi:MAG: alcohol dehydrogenase family protein [Ornithinimicrobium sp.]
MSGDSMKAIVTEGVGDYDQLVYREVPRPEPGPGEVLLRVLAAGVNNTEINTRVGWYSASVTTGTEDTSTGAEESASRTDGGWNAATPFPLIQGADCCGRVVAVGPDGDEGLLDARVLVRACMRTNGFGSTDQDPGDLSEETPDAMETRWLGSDFDGAFAQFVVVPAGEVFTVDCDWTDAELATIPCAYGTAENMVQRAGVHSGSTVLVPGASGGVGSALVQLLKRRGAKVIGMASEAKHERVLALGADQVLGRDADVVEALGQRSVDVVIDNVAGAGFPAMLAVLRRGGTYVSSGAIGGPAVDLDLRTMYLSDLTLVGCTAWDEPVFTSVIDAIESGEIQPLLEKTFPLEEMANAQREFLTKGHVGKFALIPAE